MFSLRYLHAVTRDKQMFIKSAYIVVLFLLFLYPRFEVFSCKNISLLTHTRNSENGIKFIGSLTTGNLV